MSPTRPRSALWRLAGHLAPHRARVLWACTCSVLNKLFDLAPPFLIGVAIDVVTRREASWVSQFGVTDLHAQLWWLGGLTVVVWSLESIFQYLYGVQWRGLAQTVQHELRLEAYGHVQDLEMAWFEDQSSGGLMAVLNDDVNQLERFLDHGANDLLQVATTTIVITAAFFRIAPEVAWMSMLPIPAILWGSFLFQRRIAPRYAAVREQAGLLGSQLANNLGGMATIKSFTAEAREVERIRLLSDAYRERNRGAIRLSSAFSPLIRMVIVCGFTATLVYGGIRVLDGALEPSLYAVMAFLTQRLLWPLTRLGETFDLYQRAMASATRVMDLLERPIGIRGGEQRLDVAQVRGALEMRTVDFHYVQGFPVLRKLSLEIAAGRTAAVVGPTGSGKTTLIKLLLRFYDPTQGCVLLDGHDLRALNLGDLRSAIGLVSQDVFLFHGTVLENIAYARPGATREQVMEAARVAEAHSFILGLPLGYETVVGERGQKLSGGQRQRVSLARAVLKDPPVLLLDEATSAVDNETEALIQRSLERLSVGRTTLVIAHRLSTVRHADCIYVLEDGRLCESGRHEQLLERGGVYAGLWSVQTGERAADAAPHAP